MEGLATAPMEQLAEYPLCVVCGSRMLAELAGPDRMAMERLLSCEECGTLARDPHLSTRGSLESYAQDACHPEYEAAFDERMPELVRWVGPNARVLEVGSFVGGFLASARRRGWRAEGVDVGRLEDRCYPSRRFDAVFVWSCFDQLPQPWSSSTRSIGSSTTTAGCSSAFPTASSSSRFNAWRVGLLPAPSARACKGSLALAGLAGFPHQLGYTASSSEPDASRLRIRLQSASGIRRRGRSGGVHAATQLLQALTLGAVNWGPWIEVSCSKAPLTFAGNELPPCARVHPSSKRALISSRERNKIMNEMNQGNGSGGTGILMAVAAGAIVGAGVALLFAPCSGVETRDWLARRSRALRRARRAPSSAASRRSAAPAPRSEATSLRLRRLGSPDPMRG